MQEYETGYNVTFDSKKKETKVKVLVTGASGFIGSRVVSKLLSLSASPHLCNKNYEILCLTRNKESLEGRYEKHKDIIKIVVADVNHYPQLVKAMNGVNVAFYLIHSMEGSSKEWKKFSQRDRQVAENFAKAATECGVERIIYLGGLVHEESRKQYSKLSDHMRSRKEVGDILRTSSARVTIFRAAVILGQGGGSFQMLEYLVEDDTIKKLIPIRLKTFEEAIKAAEEEEYVKGKVTGWQRTSHSLNNKLLIVSLFAMAAIGSTYYMLDARPEVFQVSWLILSGLWYFSIAFSLFFVFNGARLGAITAGIIGWITLIFWLVDNIYTVSGKSLFAMSPDIVMTLRNFVGAAVAAIVVVASHNIYHKIRVNGL